MATIKGLNQDYTSPPSWKCYRITPGSSELTGTVDIALDTIPQGTTIMDVGALTVTAEAGATSSALDIEVGAATLLDCGADNLGSASARKAFDGTATEAIAASNVVLISADAVLNCEITYVGTATVAPVFEVWVLAGRLSEP